MIGTPEGSFCRELWTALPDFLIAIARQGILRLNRSFYKLFHFTTRRDIDLCLAAFQTEKNGTP